MTPILVTPPAVQPITLDEALNQMRANGDGSDAFTDDANAFIAAAGRYAEVFTGRALITRDYRGFLDAWPMRAPKPGYPLCQARYIELPMPPLQSVGAITVYDDLDVATVVDPATYYVDTDGDVGRIVLRKAASWPTVGRAANGIKVEWTAGFGDSPGDIPAEFHHAIRLMVSHFNEHREAVVGVDNRDSSAPLPLGVAELLAPWRIYPV